PAYERRRRQCHDLLQQVVRAQILLQGKTTVIGGDTDAHMLSLLLARKTNPHHSIANPHPLRPLRLSNCYRVGPLPRDPPLPGHDPREPGRPESKHLRHTDGPASLTSRFRSRATTPAGRG